MVLYDWEAVTYPYQRPDIPPVDVLVQRSKSSTVETVFVAGEAIYRDGRFAHIDKKEVLAEITACFARPRRDSARAQILRRLSRRFGQRALLPPK
jgi:5-methylthioadenosine/S-adenosylhomocysteine deaminase